jgi:putative RNA 2'-phosphotransferase
MTQGTLTERITRSLAYMLRHRPEEFDLDLDGHGAGELGDVVNALCDRLGEDIEASDVQVALDAGGRSRYAIEDGRIRALYGHSFSVDPGENTDPPEFLYVGVGSRDARRAEEDGLRGGRRAFLHLALTYEEAQEMGRRAAPEYAVIKVHAAKAAQDGSKFYDRTALYLAEDIGVDSIEVGEIHEDGIRREGRGERGRGGSGRGGSGRGERGGSGRGGRGGSERGPRPRGGGTRVGGGGGRSERVEETAEPVQKRAVEEATPAKDSAPGFGDGMASSAPEPAPEPAPERKPEPKPAPKPKSKPKPKPKPTNDEPTDSGAGFGAGIL